MSRERETRKRSSQKESPRRGVNRRALQDAYDQSSSGGFDKFPNGRTKVRMLPNPDNNGVWFTQIWDVYVPGPKKGDKKNKFVSPKARGKNEYCPVKAVYDALIARGEKDKAEEIRPNEQYVSNAMVKEGGRWVYKLLKYPKTVMRPIVQWEMARSDEEEEDEEGWVEEPGVADPDTGRIVSVERSVQGGRTSYAAVVTDKELPVEDEWMDERVDLTQFTVPSDVDEIEDAICDWLNIKHIDQVLAVGGNKQRDEEDDDEDDYGDRNNKERADTAQYEEEEEEKPRKKRSRREVDDYGDDEEEERPRGRRASREEEEDDDDDDPPPRKSKRSRREEEDEEEEFERRPKRKRSRRFEEEEEEEEEEHRPRKRPAGKRRR